MSAPTTAADQAASRFRPDALRSGEGRRQLRRAADQVSPDLVVINALIKVVRAAVRRQQIDVGMALLERARKALPKDAAAAVARLDAAVVRIQLDAGDADCQWWEMTLRCLDLATDPSDVWTPDLVADATDLAFHRTLHFDSPQSPLAANPEGFLAPFRANAAIQAALSRPQRTDAPPAGQAGYEAVMISQGNVNFASGVSRLLDTEFASFTHIDLAAFHKEFPTHSHDLIAEVVAGRQVEWWPIVDVLLGHSQLIWAEWAQRQALVPSHALGPGPRMVVRLHAYEVFTAIAQFLDWRRVDALVVVSPTMANAVKAILPLPAGLPVHVVPNHLDPDRFPPDKTPGARTTLALVGHNSQVKDPDFALDVLDLVRADRPEARLLMIGDLLTGTSSAQGPAAEGYTRRYLERLQSYRDCGAVSVTGRTEDVAGALADAGFILSTSRRESFHQGLIEGALSGCVPAVRDWPIMAPFGGPATFLPRRWVGTTPRDLADRILAVMSDAATWQEERMRCRAEAVSVVADPGGGNLTQVVRGDGA